MPQPDGLYDKYIVLDAATGEPVNAFTFTLRPDTDHTAFRALAFYANSTPNGVLAEDIRQKLLDIAITADKQESPVGTSSRTSQKISHDVSLAIISKAKSLNRCLDVPIVVFTPVKVDHDHVLALIDSMQQDIDTIRAHMMNVKDKYETPSDAT